MLTKLECQAIRERAEKATEGPWKVDDADIYYDVTDGFQDWSAHNRHKRSGAAYDATFIAASRTDIPALLDTVQELRELLDEAALVVDYYLSNLRLRVAGGKYARREQKITRDREKHVKQVERLQKRINATIGILPAEEEAADADTG